MTIASVANRTTNTTSGQACLEIIAGANTGYKLLELGAVEGGGTNAGFIGLGFPQAKGVTPTTPVTLISEDQNNTTTINAQTALAWGTAPTIPAVWIDRLGSSSVAAAQAYVSLLTFPRGLVVTKNKSLVLWNIISSIALDVWCVVEE